MGRKKCVALRSPLGRSVHYRPLFSIRILSPLQNTLVVVRHLETSTAETALDVEALVGLAAVKDALVAADLLGDEIESLDEAETELLALLVLCDGDVLDVTDLAKAVDAVGGGKKGYVSF